MCFFLWIINLFDNRMLRADRRSALKKLALLLLYKKLKHRRSDRRQDIDSALSGGQYLNEIIEGNPTHCGEILRMDKKAFSALCANFRNKGWLKNSRYISVEEKTAMFLLTLNHNMRNRTVKRRFNHSLQTTHFYFHEVLQAMLKLAKEMVVAPLYESETWHKIIED